MKRILCLLMALCMVFALFAACGSNSSTPTPTSSTGTDDSGTDSGAEAPEPVEILVPYGELPHDTDLNLAVNADGTTKYTVDENLYPTEPYEYTLPLTTDSDTKFTAWKIIFDSTKVDDNGLNNMPFQTYLRENTGVNIDYLQIGSADATTRFSTDLAGDALCDLVHIFYNTTGTAKDLINEKYIANIADYRAYIPNYLYQIPRFNNDVELEHLIWYDSETIPAFYGMQENCAPSMGPAMRGDWLDDLGINAADLNTYEEVHDALTRFKVELGQSNAMQLTTTIELLNGIFLGGMNTGALVSNSALPYVRVENSKVVYTATEEIDRQAMEMLSTWYAEELIDTDWSATLTSAEGEAKLINGDVGFSVGMNPGVIGQYEPRGQLIDLDYYWVALPWTVLTDDFKIQYGSGSRGIRQWATTWSGYSINAKSSNVPLLISYCDWMNSPSGGEMVTWGEEGYGYTYNDKGEKELTEEGKDAFYYIIYGGDPFNDVGLLDQMRQYTYPEGYRLIEWEKGWFIQNYPFQGGMDWPSTNAKGTDEQTEEISDLTPDTAMFIAENYLQFLDGSKPMSDWDAYVSGLSGTNLPRIKQIQQDIYDKFIAENPEYAQK